MLGGIAVEAAVWAGCWGFPQHSHPFTPISTMLMRGGVSGLAPPANLTRPSRGPRGQVFVKVRDR